MNAAEVVPKKIQGQSCMEIRPLFRECVRQAREPSNLHSHGEILSFNVGSANPAGLWSSPLWDRNSIYYFGGRISVLPVAGRGIYLYQLGKVNASSQAVMDGIHVRLKSIRCDLESALSGIVKFFREGYCISRCAPPKVPSQNQFIASFDSDKAVDIAAHRVAACIVLFLAADESPKLVTLDIGNSDVANAAFQKPFALFADQGQKRENSSVVKPGNSLYRADRASLAKKLDYFGGVFDGRVHAAKRRSMIFGESLSALITAETLKAVSVLPKFLAAGVAVVTGHREPCLSWAIGSQ